MRGRLRGSEGKIEGGGIKKKKRKRNKSIDEGKDVIV
jgi:hypothetical protein